MVPNGLTDTSAYLNQALNSENLLAQTGDVLPRADFLSSLWVGGVFIFMLLILLSVNTYLVPFFKLYLSSFFFAKDLYKIRDHQPARLFFLALMIFFSFILAYRMIDSFDIQNRLENPLAQWQVFLIIPALISGFFLVKYIILKLADRLLHQSGRLSIVLTAGINFFILTEILMGIYDLLRNSINSWTEIMTRIYPYIDLFLLIVYLFYIYKLIRSLRLHKFFMILYLCILEILPMLLIVRLFLKYI